MTKLSSVHPVKGDIPAPPQETVTRLPTGVEKSRNTTPILTEAPLHPSHKAVPTNLVSAIFSFKCKFRGKTTAMYLIVYSVQL